MEECDLINELKIRAEKSARNVIQKLRELSITAALAESCTAGLVSAFLADTPGASAVLWGSYVCYTKEAKISMLGLDETFLTANGLVSRETALSMAAGVLKKSGADIAAAVTGLAGPDGDGSDLPVGTVWIAAAVRNGETLAKEFHFTGSRNEVRQNGAIAVMEMSMQALDKTR